MLDCKIIIQIKRRLAIFRYLKLNASQVHVWYQQVLAVYIFTYIILTVFFILPQYKLFNIIHVIYFFRKLRCVVIIKVNYVPIVN